MAPSDEHVVQQIVIQFFTDLGMTPVQRIKHMYVTWKFSNVSRELVAC